MSSELFRSFSSRRARLMTPDLTHLDMSHIAFSPSAINALCDPRILPSLTHLALCQTVLNDAAAQALIDSGIMGRLTVLDLRFNHHMDNTMHARLIAHARHYPDLTLQISPTI